MKQAKIGVYLKRKVSPDIDNICGESSKQNVSNDIPQESPPKSTNATPSSVVPIRIDLDSLPWDPVHRPQIFSYDPNQREEIRRLYYDRGPCRPRGHDVEKQGGNDAFGWITLRNKVETMLLDVLEVYHFLRDHNEAIRAVTLENAPKNCTLTSPQIQKDVVDCFAKEIVKSICLEVGTDVFSVLVDESSDVSKKEQMAIVLRYVDKYGLVKERFVGIVQFRGQGYNGASNMRGEFNGLEALILKENESAYYVNCFAHQPQLMVVAVAKNHDSVDNFFDILSIVTNVFCGSCKPKDMMRESFKERLEKEIARGEIEIGEGKNQEVTLIRARDTRLGSHHRTITSLIKLFPEVLKMVDMAESHSKSHRNKVTNQHHFEVDIFNTVLDMQIQEFGDRFRESSTELLENMAALSPHSSFTNFNVSNLVKLSEMYPHDFTYMERLRLPTDLAEIMSNDKDFSELSSISKLASLMVEKNKHIFHPLVYRLLKLALILPVATATVERCFSKMKLVKTDLRNRMGEEYFNGALIYAIEKEELININVTNEVVRKQFFSMKDRKGSK
ncbi:zinc finger MYM-type protein 1-like protein [Tanacetum coccineum]